MASMPAKIDATAPSNHEGTMRLPKMIGSRKNPAEAAMAEVDRLQAQRRKLDGRLADAVARVEAAQAARRQALIESDPSVVDMLKLDKACADAAEARAGVEEAARHVAVQLEDAERAYAQLVDAAKRAEVIAACEARADAIDEAAKRFAEAARIFNDARIELEASVAEHGIDVPTVLGPLGVPLIVQPIVDAAMRAATGKVLQPAFFGDIPPTSDPLIAARQVQSGRLRDVADDLRQGVLPVAEPVRPTRALVLAPRVQKQTVRTVLSRGIEFDDGDYGIRYGLTGGNDLPPDVANAARHLGIGLDEDSRDGKAILATMKRLPINSTLKRVEEGWVVDRGEVPEGSKSGKPVAPPNWLWLNGLPADVTA